MIASSGYRRHLYPSLFTIIILVGLSLTTLGQHGLENHSSCDANIDVAKKLLVFVVVLFSFFLLSSLVAQGMKLALNLLNSKDVDKAFRAHINLRALRLGVVGSAIGFVMGCLFLVLSNSASIFSLTLVESGNFL